jgi:hypothetical protein
MRKRYLKRKPQGGGVWTCRINVRSQSAVNCAGRFARRRYDPVGGSGGTKVVPFHTQDSAPAKAEAITAVRG